MALPATDSFTNDNGTQLNTHNANWDEYNAMDINSNAACPDTPDDECSAAWEGDAFNDDQYSQGTIAAMGGSSPVGVSVRDDGAGTYYGWYSDNSTSYLFKMVGELWTQLGDSGAQYAGSDLVRLEAEGTTLTPLVGGAEEDPPGAQTDGAISSGSAGLSGYGDGTGARIDDWEGGNLAGETTYSFTAAMQASLKETPSVTAAVFANLKETASKTAAGYAMLQMVAPLTAALYAVIKMATSVTAAGYAVLKESVEQTVAGQAVIKMAMSATAAGYAVLKESASKTAAGYAVLKESVSQTAAGQAVIKMATSTTAALYSYLQDIGAVSAVANLYAVFKETASNTVAGQAVIKMATSATSALLGYLQDRTSATAAMLSTFYERQATTVAMHCYLSDTVSVADSYPFMLEVHVRSFTLFALARPA